MSRDSVRLEGDASAPSRARRFVASCSEGLPTEARDVVLLLTSELVTNAVVHGEGEVLLEIRVDSANVSVAAWDQGDGVVRPASRFSWPETGHGLTLVRELSDRWGVEQPSGTSGKRVWFELKWGAMTHTIVGQDPERLSWDGPALPPSRATGKVRAEGV